MASVSVLIPFRDTDGRSESAEWIRRRWEAFWPEVNTYPDDGRDPFSKSQALNTCARAATGDVYILVDADAWCEPRYIARAVDMALDTGRLVQPASVAHRLLQGPSERILQLAPDADVAVTRDDAEMTTQPVGGIQVITAASYWKVNGYDERFRGWGGEDQSFIIACGTLLGPKTMLDGEMWMLWHPRPREAGRRVWTGQKGRNTDLLRAYSKAKRDPATMRALVHGWCEPDMPYPHPLDS